MARARSPDGRTPELSLMVNMTGLLLYSFLGLKRRAKQCLRVRLVWVGSVLQRKPERPGEKLAFKEWVTEE